MRFGILGPLEVRSADGEPVPVGGPRPRALLVLLLLDAGRVVGVDRIIAGQYGQDAPADAANAVQAQVSRLRRSLGTDLVEFRSGGYRLAVDPDDVDAHRFEALAGDGRRLLAAGDHARAAAALRDALALWRGEPLVDLPGGDAMAVRLAELRLAATEDLVEAELALPAGTSVGRLRTLVAAHPLRERLRGQLMRALDSAGRPAEALAEYEDVRTLLADELGADPSPELAEIHLAVLRAERPARRGLAAPLTSFVGRDRELAQLAGLRECRLVTVLGPGGVGKTRLAVESARDRSVCFVDLSAVDNAVPQAVLGALGLREVGFQATATDPVARLLAALHDQELLLILDNCEHVIATAAELARTLLAACPGLSILATSREPLGLTGETTVPLAPLDSAAVRLFADRAAAVRPGFAVTPDNAAVVADICATLDGLPLAIELAAARLRQFGVAELATRLAEHGRFRLLARGDRTAAERHRTLRAVVEWSWDLLEPAEQVLARRFAVFTGGAPLAAVEAVCDVEDADVLLADLVDKSLVATDGTRYRMLETIRLLCAERLAEAGELATVRRAHADHHLALARRADPHLRRTEQLEWLAVLAAEHDNLMAALNWSVREHRPTAFSLVATLAAYWWLSGRRSQAGRAASALLAGEAPDDLAEEYVSCVVHAVPRAEPEQWARAKRNLRTLDRPARYPFGVALWAMAAGPPDRNEDGARLLGNDPWIQALSNLGTSLVAMMDGHTADSERGLVDVLARFRSLGERWGTAQALDGLAVLAGWRGEWSRAHELWADALTLMDQLGADDEYADLLCHRADCLVRQHDLTAAAADYRLAAGRAARSAGSTPVTVLLGLGDVARLAGDPATARRLLAEALATARPGDFSTAAARVRVLTALARLACDDPDRHRAALAGASTAVERAGVAEGLAGAALAGGDGERAALLLGVAVALRGTALTGDQDVARIAAGAAELTSANAFAVGYARGAAMSPDEALTTLSG